VQLSEQSNKPPSLLSEHKEGNLVGLFYANSLAATRWALFDA
jgi:hypothetical protein